MEVKPELVAVVVVIAALLLFLNGKRRRPKEKTFRCARCSATTPHTARTINAWREGKTKFFCGSCHAAWLKTQPNQHAARRTARGGERSGCLGVVACLALLPLAMIAMWWRHT